MQTLTTLLKSKRVAGKLFKGPGVPFCKNKTEYTQQDSESCKHVYRQNKSINFTVVDIYINTVYFLAVSDVKEEHHLPSLAVS